MNSCAVVTVIVCLTVAVLALVCLVVKLFGELESLKELVDMNRNDVDRLFDSWGKHSRSIDAAFRKIKSVDESVVVLFDEHEELLRDIVKDETEMKLNIAEMRCLYDGIVKIASKSNLEVSEWLETCCDKCEVVKACRGIYGALERSTKPLKSLHNIVQEVAEDE